MLADDRDDNSSLLLDLLLLLAIKLYPYQGGRKCVCNKKNWTQAYR